MVNRVRVRGEIRVVRIRLGLGLGRTLGGKLIDPGFQGRGSGLKGQRTTKVRGRVFEEGQVAFDHVLLGELKALLVGGWRGATNGFDLLIGGANDLASRLDSLQGEEGNVLQRNRCRHHGVRDSARTNNVEEREVILCKLPANVALEAGLGQVEVEVDGVPGREEILQLGLGDHLLR